MGDRRPSRWQDEDSESEHEKIIHIQCWIPGEGIDLTVLASYLKEYIDDTATIRQSRSPQDRDKTGFTISAQATISVEGLRDLIKDSKLWAAETKSREYRRDPYPYTDSDTWIARKRSGPTPGHKNPRQRRRRAAATEQASASEPPQQRQTAAGARHADVPPPYSLPRNDPSPTRGPRPRGPDPDAYASLVRDTKNVQLVDENQRPGANQSTKLQTTTSRHAATKDDDSKSTGNRLPVATTAKGNNQRGGSGNNNNNPKDGRHDERSYSYH